MEAETEEELSRGTVNVMPIKPLSGDGQTAGCVILELGRGLG